MHVTKKSSLLILTGVCILLALVSIALRIFNFGTVPQSLYIDEVAMLVDAKALVSTGKDMHGGSWFQALYPSYGDYKMPVYIWAVYAFSALFSPSAVTVRLPSLLAGFASLGVTYLLVRAFYAQNRKPVSQLLLAAATLLVVGVSPWAVQFSRTGFEAHLGQALLSVAVLLLLLSEKRWKFVLGSVFFAALATYTYFSVRYVWVPVYLVWAATTLDFSLLFTKKAKILQFSKETMFFVIPLMIFFLALLPLLYSPLYQASMQFRLSTPSVLDTSPAVEKANYYRELAGNTVIDRVVLHRWYFSAQALLENISKQLSLEFLFINGDSNLRHGTGMHGLFLFPFVLPFIAGIYHLARAYKKTLLLLATWILAAALPAAVPLEVPHALRFLNALVPLSICVVVGITETILWYNSTRSAAVRTAAALIFTGWCMAVVYAGISYTYYYFLVYPVKSQEAWDYTQTQLATAVSPFISEPLPVVLYDTHEKFYLWLLAFGPYSGTEFSSWESEQFQFTSFGTVSRHLSTTQKTRVILSKDGSSEQSSLYQTHTAVPGTKQLLTTQGQIEYYSVIVEPRL